jgi:hypothetical protein
MIAAIPELIASSEFPEHDHCNAQGVPKKDSSYIYLK